MRKFPLVIATSLMGLGLLFQGSQAAYADPPTDPSKIVARIGKATISVGELQRRIAHVPRFQLGAYGTSPDEIRRNFLEKVLVPEYLYAQAAADRGLASTPEAQTRQRDILKTGIVRRLREEIAGTIAVTDQDIAAYYNQHIDRYQAPMRVSIWRIRVKTRDDALQVLAQVKRENNPKAWVELARAKSVDQTTNLSGGNFGFVSASGDSADYKFKVPQSVVDAAFKVRDGDFVEEPIAEGDGFAVIWRRGSTPALSRTLLQEHDVIHRLLQHQRASETQDRVIAQLKKERLRDLNPGGIDLLEVSANGQVTKKNKPGRIERRPAQALPEVTPRGIR